MHAKLIVTSFAAVAGAAALIGAGASRPAAPAPVGARAAKSFAVDPVHSSVIFRVNHLGVTPFYGRFNEVSGEFSIDPENPSAGSIEVTVQAASVDTNNAKRDDHLRQPDFFNAGEFPTITFKSTGFEKKDASTYSVTGDLTLLGSTRTITVDVEHTGDKVVGGNFGHRAGFETIFTISRSDYDMTYMVDNGMLGDDVRLIIAVEGVAN